MKKRKTLNQIVKTCFVMIIIIEFILQTIHKDWSNVFLCLLSLFLCYLPTIIVKKYYLTITPIFESIIYFFIFFAILLGEVFKFYTAVPHWDTLLHALSGSLSAALAISILKQIVKEKVILSIIIISISTTIGVLWELCEFSIDYYFQLDMQKDQIVSKISTIKINQQKPIIIKKIQKTVIDTPTKTIQIENGYLDIGLIDTMKDLFVTIIGAILFSILYSFDKKRKLMNIFIIQKKNMI